MMFQQQGKLQPHRPQKHVTIVFDEPDNSTLCCETTRMLFYNNRRFNITVIVEASNPESIPPNLRWHDVVMSAQYSSVDMLRFLNYVYFCYNKLQDLQDAQPAQHTFLVHHDVSGCPTIQTYYKP
jgi:alpha-L-arabinofuranosidase